MSSRSPLDAAEPQLLPSLPSSPVEEDLSKAHAWSDEESGGKGKARERTSGKGKGRLRSISENGFADSSEGPSEREPDGDYSTGEVYPPTNDEETETRRVEENLRRWEMAERQRRKAARLSTGSPPKSVVSDVTRRASVLWTSSGTRRTPKAPNPALGRHTALRSEESVDVVPLDSLDSRSMSNTPSPIPSASDDTAEGENPFAHPADASPALMNESSNPPTPAGEVPPSDGTDASHAKRPVLQASSTSFVGGAPPPKPLGLPPPRTPPPSTDSPKTARQPTFTREPDSRRGAGGAGEDDAAETRWWHDWLCGCGEGPDRGGDNQAGRTNPME